MLRRIQLAIGAITLAAAGLALVLATARDAYSVAVGGGLVVVNLVSLDLLSRPVRRRLARDAAGPTESASPAGRGAGLLLALLLVGKMLLLFLAVYLLLRYRVVAPIGFAIGLTALPVGAALGPLLGRRSAGR